MPLQSIQRTANQRFDDEIVEARGYESEAQVAGQQLPFDHLRLFIGH
jgi:hypothetical protein